MRNLVVLSCVVLGLAGARAAPERRERVPFRIVKKDARLDAVLPPSTVVERVATGFTWVEGPLWSRDGFLLFTDIPANRVVEWVPGRGTRDFLLPAGYTGTAPFTGWEPGANGLAWDAKGRLLLCQHGDRRIARLEASGGFTTVADRYEGRRLNSPNDLVVRANGDVYFTDPPFGLPKAFDDPKKELPFSGVYRVDAAGRVTLLTRALDSPNGLAFSPDERTLYVTNANAKAAKVWAFPLREDGTLEDGRVVADVSAAAQDYARRGIRTGNPDGIKVDRSGRLYFAGPGGVHVLLPDGTFLGMIEFPGPVSNLAWGEDPTVLYITADTSVYRVKLASGF